MGEGRLEYTLRDAAMDYHRRPTPGKISIAPTKSLVNQRDLSLAAEEVRRFGLKPIVVLLCTPVSAAMGKTV